MTLADKIWSGAFVLAAILALVVYAGFVEPWLRRRDQARKAHAYAERVSCAVVQAQLDPTIERYYRTKWTAPRLLADEMSHPHQPMPGAAYDPEVRP